MNSPLHLKNRVKLAGHLMVPGWSLTTPYGARPGIGRCYHIRRRPAPVRYVTTQEKILKNRPVPGRLSNSPVMCKPVKSYDVSFICDHSISEELGFWNHLLYKVWSMKQFKTGTKQKCEKPCQGCYQTSVLSTIVWCVTSTPLRQELCYKQSLNYKAWDYA